MIISVILGVVATLGLALKTYWYKFDSLFSRLEGDDKLQSSAAEADERGPPGGILTPSA